MQEQTWVRLDNASNIFLAAMSERDPKVYRLTAEMSEEVDPIILQKALTNTYDQYLLYHSVLRRGIFWYYLEVSDLQPEVMEEFLPSCTQIYQFDRKNLLFRVLYFNKRIHLEVFHALTDGTGSSWFFHDLIKEYISLKNPNKFEETKQFNPIENLQDSFNYHFREKSEHPVLQSARLIFRSILNTGKKAGKFASGIGKKASGSLSQSGQQTKEKKEIYQVKGKRTPDHRPRVVEVTLPIQECLPLAREKNVSLTIYMTALFFEAVRKASSNFKDNQTISISVPINLRQFFFSESPRNFFTTTELDYTYGKKNDTLDTICRELNEQLKNQLNPEKIENKLRRLIAFEHHPFLRIIPRPLKDLILKGLNWRNNKNITIAMSNLGRVEFPENMKKYIDNFYFHTSAVRPQFCMISYENDLTISFTSPFEETDIQKEFVRLLTNQNVNATVAVNQVTREEIGDE